MATSTISIEQAIYAAKCETARAAARKDYKVRSIKARQMREIAREWSAAEGYKICTLRELKEQYGELVHYTLTESADIKCIWAVVETLDGRRTAHFASIQAID